jgi:hypothetical protein
VPDELYEVAAAGWNHFLLVERLIVAIFFVTIILLEYSAGGFTCGVPGGRVSCGYIGINW